jgi:hypothetical protein
MYLKLNWGKHILHIIIYEITMHKKWFLEKLQNKFFDVMAVAAL